MQRRVLLVDDDSLVCLAFSRYLESVGYAVVAVHSLQAMQEALEKESYDGLLLDLQLPDGHGLGMIALLRQEYPDTALIVITGTADIPQAVEAMRLGADHFLTKPVDLSALEMYLRRSLEVSALRRIRSNFQRLAGKQAMFFGRSEAHQKLHKLSLLATSHDAPVLIQGETGCGKSVLARWIHDHSHRKDFPFVEVNCSMLRGDALVSEIFGHAKGAFPHAYEDQQGLLDLADGGTLFLDEIGEMDPHVQSQFLKVLEEKVYRRAGELFSRKSNFRLICSTHYDLSKESERPSFRRDLFFRIYVFPIVLPPLRFLLSDLSALCHFFLARLGMPEAKLSAEVLALLSSYEWPGNLRELCNVLERALLLSSKGEVAPEHFPGLYKEPTEAADPTVSLPTLSLDYVEALHIKAVLARYEQDAERSAKALGISRATLYRKMKRMKEVLSSVEVSSLSAPSPKT
jgi:DNA-binding NtrC family response regulator